MKSIPRQSNFELLRIFAMFMIICGHYIYNSGITDCIDLGHPTLRSTSLRMWGMWGKACINVFVLLTGYFMCQSKTSVLRHFIKLLFEVLFYGWIVGVFLMVIGAEPASLTTIAKRLFRPNLFININVGFTTAFLWMYPMIPAFNIFIRSATKRQFFLSIGFLLVMFTGCGTFFNANVFHHVFWYMTVYFIGAAIRLYPLTWMSNNRICIPFALFMIVAALASHAFFDILAVICGHYVADGLYGTIDSHIIFAIGTAIPVFLVFKNLKIAANKWINALASTCFGVLLIHADSDAMRTWLWRKVLDVPSYYTLPAMQLIALSLAIPALIFIVCAIIDQLRISYIEKPFLNKLFSSRIFLKTESFFKTFDSAPVS